MRGAPGSAGASLASRVGQNGPERGKRAGGRPGRRASPSRVVQVKPDQGLVCASSSACDLLSMKTRAIERIFVVGLLDLAYRLFLRDIVRRRIGIETSTTRLASLAPPARRV